MAQRRGGGRGNAKNAPMSVPRTSNPDPDHFVDLVAYIKGRPNLVVMAKEGTMVRGYAPGDDEGALPRMLVIPVGGVAQVVVDAPPAMQQDATVLASMVAGGTLDIVDAKHFNGDARPHAEIHAELRQVDLARIARRQGGAAGIPGDIAALKSQVAELTAALAQIELEASADREPKAAATKKK